MSDPAGSRPRRQANHLEEGARGPWVTPIVRVRPAISWPAFSWAKNPPGILGLAGLALKRIQKFKEAARRSTFHIAEVEKLSTFRRAATHKGG